MISTYDKLQCAVRELGYRRHVYKRWVGEGRMSETSAQREIMLMEAIVVDYRAQLMKEQLPFDAVAKDDNQRQTHTSAIASRETDAG